MRKLPFSRWRRYTTRDGGIDPSGRMLVAQHNMPVKVRDGDQIKTVMAGLSVLRIGDDGKLEFVRKYDIDVGDKTMWWMGMVPLPT
jgi:6-phosphogluconolactonase